MAARARVLSLAETNEFLEWWALFQHQFAWLWRKHREPGGLLNEGVKPFAEKTRRDRIAVRYISRLMIRYLRAAGPLVVSELADAGDLILEGVADVETGALDEELLGGVPLKQEIRGQKLALIREELLNHLAFEHHEAWLKMREWSWTLDDSELHQPRGRREHFSWNRDKPAFEWGRDRGNIYGLSFALALMRRDEPDRFDVLLNAVFGASDLESLPVAEVVTH